MTVEQAVAKKRHDESQNKVRKKEKKKRKKIDDVVTEEHVLDGGGEKKEKKKRKSGKEEEKKKGGEDKKKKKRKKIDEQILDGSGEEEEKKKKKKIDDLVTEEQVLDRGGEKKEKKRKSGEKKEKKRKSGKEEEKKKGGEDKKKKKRKKIDEEQVLDGGGEEEEKKKVVLSLLENDGLEFVDRNNKGEKMNKFVHKQQQSVKKKEKKVKESSKCQWEGPDSDEKGERRKVRKKTKTTLDGEKITKEEKDAETRVMMAEEVKKKKDGRNKVKRQAVAKDNEHINLHGGMDEGKTALKKKGFKEKRRKSWHVSEEDKPKKRRVLQCEEKGELDNAPPKNKIKEEDDQQTSSRIDVVFLSEKTGNADEVTINQERRQALQDQVDRRSQPGLGQWTTAQFHSSEQQQKFFRLMGGFKRPTQSDTPRTGPTNMALGKEAEQCLQQGLLGEFERARSRRMDFSHRGAGLGYAASSSKKINT